MHLKWFGCGLCVLLIVAQSCRANTCDCEGFYCVSDTEFQLCVDGETVGDPIACNTGLPCRNDTEKECIPRLLCQEEKACSAEGTFPDKKSITKYFTCGLDIDTLEWISNEYTCPEGTYFSRQANECTVGNVYTFLSESENIKDYNMEDDYLDNKEDFLCPGKGYFPDPQHCQNFYACDDIAVGELVKCPEDTYYNHELALCSRYKPGTCNFPVNVKPELLEDDYDITSIYPTKISHSTESPSKDEYSTAFTNVVTTYQPSNNNPKERLPVVTPTPEPFVCPGRGSYPDPTDCTKYYRCYGSPRQLTCQPGTYFNDVTGTCGAEIPERCNESKDNETVDPNGSSPVVTPAPEPFVCPGRGSYPDPTDCTKYYRCYGSPRQLTCQPGTYFNDVTGTCGAEIPERCNESKDNETVDPNGSSPVVTPAPEPFVCPGRGSYPDPTDCTKYYRCYGSPRQLTCQPGTYFNDVTGTCGAEIPERCKELNNYESKIDESAFGVVSDSFEQYYEKPDDMFLRLFVSANYDVHGVDCPGVGLFLDPEDCTKYYDCRGNPRRRSCPVGTFFNAESLFCDNNIPYYCRNVFTRNGLGKSGALPLSFLEASECEKPGVYVDSNDCRKYYFCSLQLKMFHMTCRKSMYFNDITMKCEMEIPDRCLLNRGDLRTILMPRLSSEFACTGRGNFADKYDIFSYYYCSDKDSKPVHRQCPRNEYFDDNNSKCNKIRNENDFLSKDSQEDSDNSSWEESLEFKEFVCIRPGLFPDVRDCRKFYECSKNLEMRHRTCSEHTYFNEVLQLCSYFTSERCFQCSKNETSGNICEMSIDILIPHVSQSNEGVLLPKNIVKFWSEQAPTVVKSFQNMMSSSFLSPDEDMKNSQSLPVESLTSNSSGEHQICKAPGYYGDPDDCKKYYLCSPALKQFNYTCPGKLYFNEEILLCSSTLSARCMNLTLIPSSPVSSTISTTENTETDPTFPPVTTTPATSTSTTTLPTNTTPKTTTVGSIFKCTYEGVFPDPNDLTKYYRCSAALVAFHYSCPKNLRFNTITKKCSSKLLLQ